MSHKNLRLINDAVRSQLKALNSRYVVAGVSKLYSSKQLRDGLLQHLRLKLSESGLSYPEFIIPAASSGKYSDRNRNGYEVVRKDLPKETHYNSVETPNWGDSYNGTHTVDLPYEKYPRDFVAPELARIKVTCANNAPGMDNYVLVFEVDRVLDQQSDSFEPDLLGCLNLLQENVGAHGVQRSGATLADYRESLQVSWEILPPGTREEVLQRVFRGTQPTSEERKTVEDRFDFLERLGHKSWIHGTSGFQRYFGALLADDLVVFENIRYGNAIYVMFGDWRILSQRSRTELLSGRHGDKFERIVHTSGWKGHVKAVVKSRLGSQQNGEIQSTARQV